MDLDKKFSAGIYVRFDYGILETWGEEYMSWEVLTWVCALN